LRSRGRPMSTVTYCPMRPGDGVIIAIRSARLHEAGDDAQERAFPAAGRAEKAKKLVPGNRDFEPFERTHPAVLSFVGMANTARLDHEERWWQ
jgi:hypothetical protein